MNIWQAIIIGGVYWLSNIEMMYSFYWSIMDADKEKTCKRTVYRL